MLYTDDKGNVHGAAGKGSVAGAYVVGGLALAAEFLRGDWGGGCGFGGNARGIEKDVFMVKLAEKDAIIANQNAKLYAKEEADCVKEKLECEIKHLAKCVCDLEKKEAVNEVKDKCLREEVGEIQHFLKKITFCGIASTSVITPPATTAAAA